MLEVFCIPFENEFSWFCRLILFRLLILLLMLNLVLVEQV